MTRDDESDRPSRRFDPRVREKYRVRTISLCVNLRVPYTNETTAYT